MDKDFTIAITATHIALANEPSLDNCPIGFALIEAYPEVDWLVSEDDAIGFQRDEAETEIEYLLDAVGRSFVRNYDLCRPVKPCTVAFRVVS